jgi:hypothetical protein
MRAAKEPQRVRIASPTSACRVRRTARIHPPRLVPRKKKWTRNRKCVRTGSRRRRKRKACVASATSAPTLNSFWVRLATMPPPSVGEPCQLPHQARFGPSTNHVFSFLYNEFKGEYGSSGVGLKRRDRRKTLVYLGVYWDAVVFT